MTDESLQQAVLQPENMTIYEAMEMRELFISKLISHQKIEVDLALVQEIDSSGLQLMIALKKDAKDLGKELVFSKHSLAVIELLDLFDMSNFFGDPVVLSD